MTKRILIVEDSPTQAQELELILTSQGFAVDHAPHAERGLELLAHNSYSLVLSDVLMPGITGYELCERIKADKSLGDMPVILLTRLSEARDILRGLESGADNFITKPYEPEHLIGRITTILARHEKNSSSEGDTAADLEELEFMGTPLRVEARREQTLNFLMSTFEEFVRAKQREFETKLTEEKRRREELGTLTEELEAMNSRLTRLASIDPLTEIFNRRGLERVLTLEMNRSQRAGSHVVAALVDLDGFKKINDQLGHAVGDVVLGEVAQRLAGALRPSDHVGRVGGDEFLLLLPDTRWAEALRVADRVRLAIAEDPLVVFAEPIRVTASLGVAMLPYETCSIEEVLTFTRLGLRDAKTGGGNRVATARQSTGPEQAQNLEELRQLLMRDNCFRAVSQPIYNLSDGSLAGYEMLSRGPEGAFQMPKDFFRVCLEDNILTMVDLKCLKSCVEASSQLRPGGRVHVNLFPSTLLDTPPERLIPLLEPDHDSTFCIEISEQQFISDPSCLRSQVEAFREAGILVAMDDVGFGRSSLEALLLLEPDLVKIDPKYVTGISKDPGKARSLERLIRVASTLDAELVAEGIEVTDDLHMLRDMGVEYGQGFLWGRPA